MKIINVKTNTNDYTIEYNDDPFSELESISGKVLVVTDENVYYHYSKYLDALDKFVVKPGEASKSMELVIEIIEHLEKNDYSKTDTLIAFGGGIIGDLTGFIASIYKRGMNYVQVPTSLLAMVDSSIGGKTGVNSKLNKNLIGVIYPPQKVYIGTKWLKTLPEIEWKNGCGEILKYAILSHDVFDALMTQDLMDWEAIIEKCILVKKDFVVMDEFDQGQRMLLNLGHTYGHVIEKQYGIKHGYAVAYGTEMIIKETDNQEMLDVFYQICEKLNLVLDQKIDYKTVKENIFNDKKVRSGKLSLIIPNAIGDVVVKEIELRLSNDY